MLNTDKELLELARKDLQEANERIKSLELCVCQDLVGASDPGVCPEYKKRQMVREELGIANEVLVVWRDALEQVKAASDISDYSYLRSHYIGMLNDINVIVKRVLKRGDE